MQGTLSELETGWITARCRNNQPKKYYANCQLPIVSYLTGVALSSAQDKVVLWPIPDLQSYFNMLLYELISD